MIRVNLLKTERKEVEEKAAAGAPKVRERRLPLGEALLLLIVVALGALIVLQIRASGREKRLLAAAQEEYQKLQPVVAKLEEVQKRRDFLKKKIDLINQLKLQQPLPIDILEEISRALPDWVWLTEVNLRNMVLSLRGKAISNVLLSDYIFNLERSEVFESVSLIDSTLRTIGNAQYLEFSLQANVVLSSNEASKTPAAQPARKTEAK
jgi:type IV pilus assembly protein PilN